MSELSWLLDLVARLGPAAAPVCLLLVFLWFRADRERIESQKESRKEMREVLAKYEDTTNKATNALNSVSTSQASMAQFLFSRKDK